MIEARHPDPGIDEEPGAGIRDSGRGGEAADAAVGPERVMIAPSCSLLHVPHEAARETGIDAEVRPWLAFCVEKLAELKVLRKAAAPDSDRDALLADARAVASARRTSSHTNDPAVR
ncbi:hypothetical protein J0H33_16785, partial [bacterium]|nr:hypothetical protein [bacterium]